MKIDMPIDWIYAFSKYGHFEGEVHFSPEREKEFKSLLNKSLYNEEDMTEEEWDILDDYKEDIKDNCDIKIDEWEIEDWGDVEWEALLD